MFERILIPLDGSETAEAILPQVRRLLKRQRTEVILLRAISALPPEFHLAAPALLHEAERYIRRMTFQFIQDGIPARGFARLGSAGEIILDTAERERATLIAMSTHGRSGFPRWVFGSVAEKVLRASPAPMLALRSFPPPLEGGLSRGRLEELPFRTILVPLDGSDCSMSVIPAVKEFGRAIDSKVILVNVAVRDRVLVSTTITRVGS